MKLALQNFAQIAHVDIDFGKPGDLTILVGQQATGKSLVLQWLKLVTDALAIRADWERYGFNWKTPFPMRALDLFFGEGMGSSFDPARTEVKLDGRVLDIKKLFHRQARVGSTAPALETTYFIPAHRALLLADGWPRNFQQHGPGTPFVARAQSERLARWLGDADRPIFPISGRLTKQVRDAFNQAIFHGAQLEIDRSSPQSRLVLKPPRMPAATIPFMAWTAGQREFVPLLLALYELMPAGALSRLELAGSHNIQTVVLEEPELGLHPKALFALGIAVIHLLGRGYRVAISSHSPLMVDFAWAISRFATAHRHGRADAKHVRQAFALAGPGADKLAQATFDCTARTYYLSYRDGGAVHSKDISELAFDSPDQDQETWGELLKYSSRLADVVGTLDLDFSRLREEAAP